jgi:Amt family ammonium transporter
MIMQLAASCGGLTWMLWDWRLERRWSVVGFCSGAVAGLIAITPAAGYVGPPAAVLFGVVAGTLCNFATQLKLFLKYDDALDVSNILSLACGGDLFTTFCMLLF